jgi:regulator of sirC expression with transglutaminase-like and TPR domain
MLCALLHLRRVLQYDSVDVPLDVAALELASIEFPGQDFEPSLYRLDHFAEQVADGIPTSASPLEFIRATNRLLFDTLQFRGNESDYYDPRNSCLNAVLSRRLGIPISLSLVYMEIARRLDRPVSGVALPGHFIAVYNDGDSRYWIDPFNHGRILTLDDCRELVSATTGADLRQYPDALSPVGARQILVRMLQNLKSIYLKGRALDKARQVLDLLVLAKRDDAEEYRLRGLIHLQQLNHRSAKADLETFLKLAPASGDREQVQQQLLQIERWKAALN